MRVPRLFGNHRPGYSRHSQQNDDIKLITEFIVAEDEVRHELGKSIFSDYAEHGRLPESFIASIRACRKVCERAEKGADWLGL